VVLLPRLNSSLTSGKLSAGGGKVLSTTSFRGTLRSCKSSGRKKDTKKKRASSTIPSLLSGELNTGERREGGGGGEEKKKRSGVASLPIERRDNYFGNLFCKSVFARRGEKKKKKRRKEPWRKEGHVLLPLVPSFGCHNVRKGGGKKGKKRGKTKRLKRPLICLPGEVASPKRGGGEEGGGRRPGFTCATNQKGKKKMNLQGAPPSTTTKGARPRERPVEKRKRKRKGELHK